MKIERMTLLTIIATAYRRMANNPDDYKKAIPVTKELVKKLTKEWNDTEEIFIEKLPF